jgi:hypothetical protein
VESFVTVWALASIQFSKGWKIPHLFFQALENKKIAHKNFRTGEPRFFRPVEPATFILGKFGKSVLNAGL